MAKGVCRHCGLKIDAHAMGDAYLPDLTPCRNYEEADRAPVSREMELEDRLGDVLDGLKFWRDHKVGSVDLSTLDEMLLRWLEHSGFDV